MAGCERCNRDGVVEVRITVAESQVIMRSCSRCEHRWWERDGQQVNLDRVLELASRK